jgi:glycosyltransferase involved in cell wall biosynthesis
LSSNLEAFCYRKAWLITGQSKTILSDISSRFRDRPTFHLSNGVDTSRFGPDKQTAAARELLGGREKTIALYAGLHGLAQGLDQLLQAAKALSDIPDLQFVLLGDGPEKQSLAARANEMQLTNLRFMESRPAGELPALVAAADIVLVPLKMHIPGAVPSKIYEAIASARPVILVADGEAAEIVQRNDAGLVVKPGDIAGLVAAIRTLHRNQDLRLTMGANGRRAAVEHFDRATIASRFIEHLEAALAHP